MTPEIKTIQHTAETLYINHPDSSYGIFCFNSVGDLFLNSDWGMYGYAWRSYGPETFKEFIGQCNSDYIVGKFGINYLEISRKKLPKDRITHLKNLVDELIKHCKQ